MQRITLTLGLVAAVVTLSLAAQTGGSGKPATPDLQVSSNLNQLMRGVLYPAANVVFSSQNDNPAEAKRPPSVDPSLATDPLISTFGGWQAVENAALALSESANLLVIPGRTCANGAPVPVNNADWPKFVQELRDAGAKAYKAAQTKNQDSMIEAADTLTTACSNCHRKYREKRNPADRCK